MTTLTDIVADNDILTTNNSVSVTNKTIVSASNTLFIDASDLYTGTVPTARLGSGTASSSTFLRGDNTWAAAGGAYVVDGRDISAPNAFIPSHTLSPSATELDVDLVIQPKGEGALLVKVPDNTATGGNKRGIYAVDLQLADNTANYHVASGDYSSLFGGKQNSATSTYSTAVGGFSNQSTGFATVTLGGAGIISSNSYGVTQGYYANSQTGSGGIAFGSFTDNYGSWSLTCGYYTQNSRNCAITTGTYGAGGSTLFPAAVSMQNLHCRTTDATATRASTANSTGDAAEIVMPGRSAHLVRFLVVAQETVAAATKAWELVATIQKASQGVPSIVGSVTKTVIAADAGASSWDCDIAIGSTNSYTVEVTGVAATTIDWSVGAFLSEVRS